MRARSAAALAAAGGREAAGAGALLLAPALCLFALFAAALAAFFGLSFRRVDPSGALIGDALTFANYGKALTDWLYLRTMLLTLQLSVQTTVAAVVLGFPLAYWIVRSPSRLVRAALIIVVAVPFMTSLIVRLYSLTLVLGNTGLINRTLQAIGVIGPDDFVPLIRNQVSVVIGLVYFVLPFVVFTLAGALRRLDVALEEAAQNLGADEVRTFFLVTAPLAGPGVVAAASLGFALSATAFATPLILGGSAVKMIANVIYDQVLFVHDVAFGAALAVIALLATATVTAVYARLGAGASEGPGA
ncbi:MAG: spermidine/putrescine ABC transporter permease [Candidatus Rokuibacteriota bacterium]|nr:MAG: spermidine/putrescine ABC transporter permease [Candidatus Rokubacteria bacterium]